MNPWSSIFLSDNRKSAIQNAKWMGVFSIAFTLVFGGAVAQAQPQSAKIPVVGVLWGSTPQAERDRLAAFQHGLQTLGYVEGKTILVEHRYAAGKLDRFPQIVAELVQIKVDVIVAAPLTAIRAAKEATQTIPIVMVTSVDPVASRLVESLARPGGNLTGLTRLGRDLKIAIRGKAALPLFETES